jgi:hypothetical protein
MAKTGADAPCDLNAGQIGCNKASPGVASVAFARFSLPPPTPAR